jgi:predicted ArsR family transcriptional regulator
MTHQPTPLDDAPTDPTTSKPRRRLLKLLRRSDTPLDVYQLADATGLHITTVRFHLDLLSKAGQVTVQKTPRTTPGRPRTVYAARAEEAPPDGYRPLAALLAANLGSTPHTRRRRAEKAGRDWASTLILATSTAASPDETAHRIVDLFAEMNFDPELADPAPDTVEREIRLRACPYRDVAREHPEVVCAIHLGLLQGALTQLGAPSTTARLVPFVKPHLCLVYLTPGVSSVAPSTTATTRA